MKILHIPFTYYPDAVGGTEIYVTALAKQLQAQGIEIVIAAPGEQNQAYTYDSLNVYRYALSGESKNARIIYGSGDTVATKHVATLLDMLQPDIVHLHALTAGVSLDIAAEAKRRGCSLVFTYHTPTVSCLRGTLMRWGDTVCDGLLDTAQCASCMLHSRGLNKALSEIMGHIPPAIGSGIGQLNQQGRVLTAMQMSYFARLRHETLRQFLNSIDRIVVLCDWVGAILMLNDIPATKIVVSRHGLATNKAAQPSSNPTQKPAMASSLRLIFLGRLHPTKGIDTVIKALRHLPDAPVTLDIYGIVQDKGDEYVEQLQRNIDDDRRIRLLDALPHENVPWILAQYDALIVPSRGLETGPLVILEAFAAGIPVLGSNLGGIAELVTHEQDGLLIEVDSIVAWQQTIQRLLDHPQLLSTLKTGIQPPRSVIDVADDMLRIYQSLL
jgi:glycosyltransferase involved in cell wall biosynthesis